MREISVIGTKSGTNPSFRQKTLKSSIHCKGVGLHGGLPVRLTLHPAEADHGIVFKRTDVVDRDPLIPARWDRVADTTLCTTLANESGTRVSTVEHLMAALAGSEIDNALIEIDGAEVPIMDGSAAPFVLLIECAGVIELDAPRKAIRVLRPVRISDGQRSVTLAPAEEFSIRFEIDFETGAIVSNEIDVALVNGTFNHTISGARTFGFLHEVDALRQAGLARGGSLDNAIVVDKETDRVVNVEGLRYDDEFVRHKVLDCVGDLALAGMPILGRVTASRSGHAYNNKLLRALFADPDSYEIIDLETESSVEWREEPALAATA